MVAAFLDSWLTGDPAADEYISKAAGPSWAEVASVAGLAVRLHLGGTPRRYAWGQAIRRAVLAVLLGPAMRTAGMIEVDRDSPDFRQIDDAAARSLTAGHSLLVYPEGTASPDGMIGS